MKIPTILLRYSGRKADILKAVVLSSALVASSLSAGIFSPGSKTKVNKQFIVASHMFPNGYVTVSAPAGCVQGDFPIQITATNDETKLSVVGNVAPDGSFNLRIPANPKDYIHLFFIGAYGKTRKAWVQVPRTPPAITKPTPAEQKAATESAIIQPEIPSWKKNNIIAEYSNMKQEAEKFAQSKYPEDRKSKDELFNMLDRQAREKIASKYGIEDATLNQLISKSETWSQSSIVRNAYLNNQSQRPQVVVAPKEPTEQFIESKNTEALWVETANGKKGLMTFFCEPMPMVRTYPSMGYRFV